MKKGRKLLLGVMGIVLASLMLILAANLVYAQEEPQVPEVFGINPENVQDPEDLAQESTSYLKREWGKMLENNPILGPIIGGYRKIAPFSDPVFKYTLGMAPELTWLFILTLIIWILLVTYLFRILSVFSTFSEKAALAISFLMIVIVSNLKVPMKTAQGIINAISVLTSWWMQLIIAIIIIVGFTVASIFSKEFEELMRAWKEKREKMKMIDEIAKLKLQGKSTASLEKALFQMGKSMP